MNKIPYILVSGLPRSGKTSFIRGLRKKNLINDNMISVAEETLINKIRQEVDFKTTYDRYSDRNISHWMKASVTDLLTNRRPVIVESNYFVDKECRDLYAGLATRDHEVLLVTVYVPEVIRVKNEVLKKYTAKTDKYFVDVCTRPHRFKEGYKTFSPRELVEYLNDNNTITKGN